MTRRTGSSTPAVIGADLSGRIAVVTGANRGMGKETAHELARMGCTVVLACRYKARGDSAAQDIAETTAGKALALKLDLSSLASVRAFAAAYNSHFPKLDVLVNNAAASLPNTGGQPRRLRDALGRVGGFMKALVVLTRSRAVTPREGPDTAVWLAASPEVDAVTGGFWNKRREKRCRFREPAEVERLLALAEEQLAHGLLTP